MPLYLNRCNFKLMLGTHSQHQGMVKVNVLYKEFSICCILALVKLLFPLVDYTTVVMLTVFFPTTRPLLDNVTYRVFS